MSTLLTLDIILTNIDRLKLKVDSSTTLNVVGYSSVSLFVVHYVHERSEMNVAGVEGIEPPTVLLESTVIPFNYTPKRAS